LSNYQKLIWVAPHLSVWQEMVIFLTVIVFIFLVDGLQEALNPKGARD
jgi:ABC-type dipeptide/oligopeptide/nickel transport system permease subunit